MPAANLGTRFAGILISEPVCGFRPVLALRCTEEKVPKPTRVTFSPLRMASTTLVCMQFSALSACPLVIPASLAIADTSSALFMDTSLYLRFCLAPSPEPQCSRSFLHNYGPDVKRKCGSADLRRRQVASSLHLTQLK